MEGAKWKSTILEILMNWSQLEFHRTEFQFYRIDSGYGVVRTLVVCWPPLWMESIKISLWGLEKELEMMNI